MIAERICNGVNSTSCGGGDLVMIDHFLLPGLLPDRPLNAAALIKSELSH
jgi:hypothetical protein